MAITVQVTIPDDLAERVLCGSENPEARLERAVLSALERAYPPVQPRTMTVDEERQLVRQAMGAHALPPDAFADLLEELGGPLTPEEEEEWERTAPVLDPPFSQTLIQMREEERY